MSQHFRAFLLGFAALGCLEGDPNPYDDTSSNAAGGAPRTITPGSACAQHSNAPVTLTLNNRSARTLRMIWVDYACVEQVMGVVAPGQSFTTNAEAQSPWRARDSATNALVFEVITTNASLQTVEINVP